MHDFKLKTNWFIIPSHYLYIQISVVKQTKSKNEQNYSILSGNFKHYYFHYTYTGITIIYK